ncbi:unnamed protein product [Paramecium primaurelia]|uniref:Uncharacterized protein n=1 Tax=Paramecium primaurelia TaxID=5886 RepID=A0A8S1LT81_PARPR|nr:unnamed protein product [Paramecium primaurelia]
MNYIIGMSVTQKHQISIQENLAYAAGSIVVYYSYKENQQEKYLIGKAQVHAILISRDGTHVFTGEQATKNPAVNIFKLTDEREINISQQLKGHKFGITQIVESPAKPYLVSLGSEPDKGLFVWDWSQGIKLTVNKLSKPVNTIRFNDNGRLLISAGQGHLKYWQFKNDGSIIAYDNMMDPKPFLLNEQFMHKNFIDIHVTQYSVFALTFDSLITVFSLQTKQFEKWMDLKATNSYSLTSHSNYLITGCSDAIIRIFNLNMQHIVTLSKPPNLGNYNIEKGITKLKVQGDQFADCLAVQIYQNYLVAAYSDRTMFLWDIGNFEKIVVKRSFLNHSASINDLQIMTQQSSIEATFFVTASSDQTLRVWHIYEQQPLGLRRNAYCKYLSKIIYIGDQYQHFKANQQAQLQIRCVRVSKDGNYLACGDSAGILRIFSTQTFTLYKQIQAHDQDIMTLDFSEYIDLLATGSRDRIINIYDDQFQKIGSLEEHTSSVTCVKFSKNKLISCGLDKAIIFREFNGQKFKIYHQEQISKIYSMDVSFNNLYICLEKKISIYDIPTGKLKQSFETDANSKILLYSKDDQNCLQIATYSDKNIKIYNNKFELIQKFQHDQLTSMGFAMDNKHFITAGHEGCIIIWKLNKVFKKKQLGLIGKKLKQVFAQQDLKSSKEWTINSLWIEDELRGFLNNNKQQQQQQQQQQNQKQEEEQVELFKFESDNEMDPKSSKQIENALSPLGNSQFNYKDQKFDKDDIKTIQNQLLIVQNNLNKVNEKQQNKYQIHNNQETIQEVNQLEEQSQLNFFYEKSQYQQTSRSQSVDSQILKKRTREEIKQDKLKQLNKKHDMLQQNLITQESQVDQTQRDTTGLETKIIEQDTQIINSQLHSNLNFYADYQQQQNKQFIPTEASLQINNATQTQEHIKQIIGPISKDSINLNNSYAYDQHYHQQLVDPTQQQIFQQTNLARCHIRQIQVELLDLTNLLNQIKDQQVKENVLREIDDDLNNLQKSIQLIRKQEQQEQQTNRIMEQSQAQLSEEDIKKIVINCSKEMFENYSKVLFEQIKGKNI